MFKKLVLILLCFISIHLKAQIKYDFQTADSISYQYYLEGKWDTLLVVGNELIAQEIDFKTLRQRMGYAYFVQQNYIQSERQYEKALAFDKSDLITLTYLYYNVLYGANETLARYYAAKLPPETQTYFKLKSFKLLDAFDLEYNQKSAYNDIRSAPIYVRAGLNTKLGYRLNLYQTVSNYKQNLSVYDVDYSVVQNEYFAALSLTVTSKLNVMLGYHYLNAKIDMENYAGNVLSVSVDYKIGSFDLGLLGSNFNMSSNNNKQIGIQLGYLVPCKSKVYLNSTIYNRIDSVSNNWIFAQSLGLSVTKHFWVEAKLTLGDLDNFVDLNGMYVYNSLDPTMFRAGLSVYWYPVNKLTLYMNSTFDKKYINDYDIYYNQNSLTGGMIWKF